MLAHILRRVESTDVRAVGEKIQHRNIQAVQLAIPSQCQLNPSITISISSASQAYLTHTLHPARSETSAQVSWLRLRAASSPLVSSPSKLYPSEAIAKLVVTARGNCAWRGTTSRKVRGGCWTSLGDDGIVVKAVSSSPAAALRREVMV